MQRAKPWLVPGAILALGYAAFMVYAWPGFMSIDSAQQLVEARAHAYTDWHPPAMAALWRLVEHVVTGPAGMLVLQSGAYLAGAMLLYLRVLAPRRAAIAAVLTLLFPPLLAPMAVIWKDSQMAGYLLLGFGLLIGGGRRKWFGIGVLALATAMRANAAAATLPLVVLCFSTERARAWWQRIAIASGVFVAIAGTAAITNRVLTTTPSHAWHTSICAPDIAGILEYSRKYSDEELLALLDGTPLVAHDHIFITARRTYTPVSWWRVVNGPDRIFDWPTTDEQRAALEHAWWTLVRQNPLSYLDHRAHVFREVLALGDASLFDPVSHDRVPDGYEALEIAKKNRHAQNTIARWLTTLSAKAPLSRAWIYFALALVFLPIAWRSRDSFALLASGLVYELTLFPFAPSPDVRYSHWLMTATVIATVQLICRRMHRTAAVATSVSGDVT